jgi:CubicO group peptidase (beta-lactamase class C family)
VTSGRSAIARSLVGDWLADQRARLNLAGVAAGAVLGDDPAIIGTHGYADVAAAREVTSATPFRLCSLSKTVTATLVLIARDRGLLGLDDAVTTLVPELDVRSPARDPRPITWRQCLTHTAGLPKDFDFDYWRATDEPLRRLPDMADARASLAGTELVNVPGTTFHYSNVGFALLGLAAERTLGRPYAELVEDLVLAPLGMRDSFVWSVDRLGELTRPYLRGGRDVAADIDLGAITAAGGVCATPVDLAAYARSQWRDDPPQAAAVLRGATLREAHTAAFLVDDWSVGFGLPWLLTRRDAGLVIGHPGDLVGAQVEFLVMPEHQIGVFLLSNTYTDELPALASAILTGVVGAAGPGPPAPPCDVDSAALDKAVGRYAGEYLTYDVVRRGDVLLLLNSPSTNNPVRLEHQTGGTFLATTGFAAGERARFSNEQDGRYQTIALQSQVLPRQVDAQ